MAVIEVNHKSLREVATAITSYCTKQDMEMREANNEVRSMLDSGFQGRDAADYERKWALVNANDSTAVKFRESLKNFGESLVACANEYENAQVESVNAAGFLMRLVGR